MKKALAALILTLVMVSVPVLAQPIEVSISPKTIEASPGMTVYFDMTVTNNRNMPDKFTVFLKGDHLEWYMPSVILKDIGSFSSSTVRLQLYPTGPFEGNFAFEAFAKSYSNPEFVSSDTFYISIPYSVAIKDMNYQVDENIMSVQSTIVSTHKKPITVVFEFIGPEGNVLASQEVKATAGMKVAVNAKLQLSELLAGNYIVKSYIVDTESYMEKPYVIEPVHKVIETKTESSSMLSREITIVVTNEGNTNEDYSVAATVPVDFMTGFVVADPNCVDDNGQRTCNYVLTDISPGETREVTYSIDYLPVYAVYLVLALITLSLVGFSFMRATAPKITKRHSRKGENKHSIVLHVKNPFRHHLKNVTVRDWVSPLGHVLSEEISAVKPVLRKSEAGTEIIWQLGSMKPNEERVLTYNIKTLVQGSLRMPKAYMRYADKAGNAHKIYSKPLLIEH